MADNIHDIAQRLRALTYAEMREVAQALSDTLQEADIHVGAQELADALDAWAEVRLEDEGGDA